MTDRRRWLNRWEGGGGSVEQVDQDDGWDDWVRIKLGCVCGEVKLDANLIGKALEKTR